MPSTERTARSSATILTMSLAAALVLSGCAGASSVPSPVASPGADSTVEPSEADFPPVGEPFGNAVWSLSGITSSHNVTVRDDRLLVEDVVEKKLTAYSADGAQA